MKNIVQIIMTRDKMTLADARELVLEARDAVLEAINTGEDPEETLACELGLEPDYIFELLGV